MTYRKKLIEVALPLEAINVASAREKSIRHGHPSTLHLWWARRPLAACRAVLFASLVDDPSSLPEQFPTEAAQEAERQRLFRIIEKLVLWENSTNEAVLGEARAEILRSTNGNPPPVLDPFAGGGSIPLEAQRLGLEAHASDLNPVAVLINKALIEIPPKFAGQPPVNPEARKKIGSGGNWTGAQGLAEDVRYYGKWMRDEAEQRIGHLYPKVQLPKEYGGGEATVIAWLWARTVTCPNPACGARMPLVRSFALAMKKGKQAWVEPVIDRVAKTVRFEVRTGDGTLPESPKVGRGAMFRCLVCGVVVDDKHIKGEGVSGRMDAQLMAIVAEGQRSRVYLPPTEEHEVIAAQAKPTWYPEAQIADDRRSMFTPLYGLTHFRHIFTPRQLVALTTFSDLVSEAHKQVRSDMQAAGLDEKHSIWYADAVATYLAISASKLADSNSVICSWMPGIKYEVVRSTFSRQALPMTWDYAESNPFANSSGDYYQQASRAAKVLEIGLPFSSLSSSAVQDDATKVAVQKKVLISTDPPYYDNIGYADLSDFFYVWLRRALSSLYPQLFGTLLTPKTQELIATPYRFDGNKKHAQSFFEKGLEQAFARMRESTNANYPLTVYYAFKQAENEVDEEDSDGSTLLTTASTGWETMLEGLLRAGFLINGTWPVRTERSARTLSFETNALASSIVLVCRPRAEDAPVTTRREFISALRRELPDALRKLQHGNIAPVDLAQAAIGPGMAVFSRYRNVVESTGEAMRVRTALQLINQALDEVLAEQEGDYDNDTRWAIDWFTQFGTGEGRYGDAETLSKAKNTSVQGLVEAGVLQAKGGKVTLLRREQLPEDWNPTQDARSSVWEITQHLIRALEQGGEYGAAGLLAQLGAEAEAARDLAYRLYTICERKSWAQEALAYNSLVVAWPSIVAHQIALPGTVGQSRLDI